MNRDVYVLASHALVVSFGLIVLWCLSCACAGESDKRLESPGQVEDRADPRVPASSDDMRPSRDTDDFSRESSALARVTLWPEGREPVRVSAEVVYTPEGIARGLMGRRHMAADHGMLFFMGFEDTHLFWMKNTYLALDLIFIGPDGRVVGVIADARPLDETTLSIDMPSLYVLEVNAGFAARHGIHIGTRVTFENLPDVVPT